MNDRDLIAATLKGVGRRWRFRLGLEALARLAGIAVAIAAVYAVAVRIAGPSASTVGAARIGAWSLLAAAAAWQFVRVLRRRSTPARLALYVEERAPDLRQSVVSAVELMDRAPDAAPGLIDRVYAAARQGLAAIGFGKELESVRLRRAGGWLGALTLGAAAALWLGPQSLRDSTASLVNPWRKPPAITPFTIAVEPGDAEVPKGGALPVAAVLGGFASEQVDLVYRSDSTADWDRIPMERDSLGGRYQARLFQIVRPTDYFVEAAGVRSPLYRLKVVDLPAVSGLTATIALPAYTGMPPETVDPAADLTALNGSTVTLRARTTRPAKAARLVVQGRAPIPLRATPDGGWVGSFGITGNGFYRVELDSEDGRVIKGLEYAIDALDDAAPTVRFTAPGRDTKVTSVEEVTTQIEAADDYGIRKLELVYSVNGGAEQSVALADTAGKSAKEISAAHTLFLEEWKLKPGDVISYFARATDGAGHKGSSDLYFLEIRPFDKTYRQAEQGGGGGGGGEQSAEGLSERQRQIVVGTFNALRDSSAQSAETWRENLTTVTISQGRLVGEVTSLLTKLKARAMAQDTLFPLIAAELDSAAGRMRGAEEALAQRKARAALPEEQGALLHLQRAEAAYRETQIATGQPQGGGGGGKQASADELADLFELETDKLRNQYESVRRESGEQSERKLDETLERLRRLASRQQQENERMERMANSLRNRSAQSGGGGGGSSQRQLAQETEEAARQLERLAREKNSPGLEEQARRLRQAAEEMRRAAGNESGQGAAQGNNALERLKNTTRDLERSRTANRQEEIRQLANRAQELRSKNQEAAQQGQSLPKEGADRAARLDNLGERKDGMARDVDRLAADAERLGRESAREQPKAARQLAEAADGLKNGRTGDKLRFSRELARRGSPEAMRSMDQQVEEDLARAETRLKDAAGALTESAEDRKARALDRARDLVKGLASLEERARASRERGQSRGEGADRSTDKPGDQPGAKPGNKAAGDKGGERPGEAPGQRGARGQGTGRESKGDPTGRQPGGREAGDNPARESGPGSSTGMPSRQGEPGDPRQFARELRARREAAESLRADLRGMGQETADLDRTIRELRSLENPSTFGTVKGVDRLRDDVIEGLKAFEFALWRKFGDSDDQRPALGASARVPPQYRELVEEYYRSLARGKPAAPR